MKSSSEKMMSTHVVTIMFSGKPRDMTFTANTCFAYLRQATPKRPLPEIPLEMVLATWFRTFPVISRKRDGMVGVKDLSHLSFTRVHGGRHCTGKKLQGVHVSSTRAGRLRGIYRCITTWIVGACSQRREVL